MEKIKVAINEYGVIVKRGSRHSHASTRYGLIGISDVAADWRIRIANVKEIPVYGFKCEAYENMQAAEN